MRAAADVVDGSPVLDVKPYVPFCECVVDAVAPDWVQVSLPLTRITCCMDGLHMGRHCSTRKARS
jgi:tRNA (Thr-GGU) A37 N-methylase